jgi:cyclopropane fatty-acyl-phospholipid synthase-like methyltransferase
MNLKYIIRLIYNIVNDLKYGSFLGGTKKTPYAINGAKDTANSDYIAMSFIFQDIVKSDDVLVDVGCGKGRVLNYWLKKFPNNKIIGIELDEKVAKSTANRLANYKNVNIIIGNIVEFIPTDASLFYLFNPFDDNVMYEFKEALVSKFFNNSLGWTNFFQIVYYNPIHTELFLNDSRFTCSEIELPIGYHKCLIIKQNKFV